MTKAGRDFNKVRTVSFLFSHQGLQVPTKTGNLCTTENKPAPKELVLVFFSHLSEEKRDNKPGLRKGH